MTEVLGFFRKDACKHGVPARPIDTWCIEKKLTFPVRLKSESVSLEWLERKCKENDWVCAEYALTGLLSAAKEEACEK